jgi:glycosyltransferase involved in cell wall biosynthesis
VPAFNEADNVPDLVRELRATFERHGLEGESALVDDGSTDGTAERREREAAGAGTGCACCGTAATSARRRRW